MARILELMRQSLIVDPKYFLEPNLMVTRFASLFGDSLVVLAPLFVGLVVASLLPPFFLNAWVFAPKKLMPELNRMNPIAGIGRMFSWNSLMELGKAVLKATLVGGVAVLLISHQRDEIFGLLAEPLERAGARRADDPLFFHDAGADAVLGCCRRCSLPALATFQTAQNEQGRSQAGNEGNDG